MFNNIYHAAPETTDFDMINKAVQISRDVNLPLKNDWGLGYWIIYSGKQTDRYGGWTPGSNDFNHSIAITTYHKLDCGLIKEQKTQMQIRIYYCP